MYSQGVLGKTTSVQIDKQTECQRKEVLNVNTSSGCQNKNYNVTKFIKRRYKKVLEYIYIQRVKLKVTRCIIQ